MQGYFRLIHKQNPAAIVLHQNRQQNNQNLLLAGRQLIRIKYISILFKQNLIAFTNDFLTGLTKQVIHQILEFCLGVRHLGGTKLTVRTTGGKALDDAVTDIYLIIQITPLQLIKLPIQFCLNILIRHLFEKFRMNQRTVKTTDYIKVYLGSIFRREDKMYTGSRTVTQRSTFQSRQAIHRSVQDSALADTIHSAQNIDIRTQFP